MFTIIWFKISKEEGKVESDICFKLGSVSKVCVHDLSFTFSFNSFFSVKCGQPVVEIIQNT